MNQNQFQQQRNVAPPLDVNNDNVNLPAVGQEGAQMPKLYNSYINSQMGYSSTDSQTRIPDHCITDRKDLIAPCALGFLGCCDSLRMVMGPYCHAHQNQLFNRRFVSTTNDGVTPLSSAGNCSMECFSTMFLTSTLPGRVTEDDINYSLGQLTRSMDGHSHSNLIKFFTLLTTPEEFWNMDSYLNAFKKYMVDITTDYFPYVAQHKQIIERSVLPVCISPSYFKRIQDSLFWHRVFQKVRNNELQAFAHHEDGAVNNDPIQSNNNVKVTYHIPLSMFNILDILTVLSFNFDIRTGCVGYIANAGIYDSIFVIGTATGIHNTLKNIKNKPNYCAYPTNVAKLLNELFHVPNHNLDYIILSVEPAVETEDAIHIIAAAEKRNIVPKDLYLDKITRRTEAK